MTKVDKLADKDIMILLKNIKKQFGSLIALSNINFEIKKGEIIGFLGPNGAGKSTTMKIMANLIKPNEGEVWIRHNGNLIKLNSKNKDVLLERIGFLIENPAFYPDVTPRQILTYFAKLKGYPRDHINERVVKVLTMIKMENWIDKKIGTFSKGMKQKIGIASAIIHDPDIIVLDEPYSGLDPNARKELRDFILDLKKENKTIFLSSHLLYETSEIADKIAIISHGQLIAFDTLDVLEAQMKSSLIKIEILMRDNENINEILKNLQDIIVPINGLEESSNSIFYNKELRCYYARFNGIPETQVRILQNLIGKGIPIIEFSVPKIGLLEELYTSLTHGSRNNSVEEKA